MDDGDREDREMTATALREDYSRAGFRGRLGFGESPALVIIDFALAYLQEGSPLYAGVEDTLASCERVLGAAREAGIPVIITRVSSTPVAVDGGVFYRKVSGAELLRPGQTTMAELARR